MLPILHNKFLVFNILLKIVVFNITGTNLLHYYLLYPVYRTNRLYSANENT